MSEDHWMGVRGHPVVGGIIVWNGSGRVHMCAWHFCFSSGLGVLPLMSIRTCVLLFFFFFCERNKDATYSILMHVDENAHSNRLQWKRV